MPWRFAATASAAATTARVATSAVRAARSAPYSRATGNSFATIEVKDGGSHSENSYFAEGPYGASGENYSEAGSEITNIETVDIGGVVKTVTTTCTTKVFAGGSSSAMSF